MAKFKDLPRAEACRRIDFDKVEVRPGIVNGTYILVVSGVMPCINMQPHLWPLIYIDRPEYWGIEVVACLSGGICLPTVAPYTISIPLDGITGTKGIEVIGASRSEKKNIPPK